MYTKCICVDLANEEEKKKTKMASDFVSAWLTHNLRKKTCVGLGDTLMV